MCPKTGALACVIIRNIKHINQKNVYCVRTLHTKGIVLQLRSTSSLYVHYFGIRCLCGEKLGYNYSTIVSRL